MSRRYTEILAVRAARGDVLASRELLSGLKDILERRGEDLSLAAETATFLIGLAASGNLRPARLRLKH